MRIDCSVVDPVNFAPDPDPTWIWSNIDKFNLFVFTFYLNIIKDFLSVKPNNFINIETLWAVPLRNRYINNDSPLLLSSRHLNSNFCAVFPLLFGIPRFHLFDSFVVWDGSPSNKLTFSTDGRGEEYIMDVIVSLMYNSIQKIYKPKLNLVRKFLAPYANF